MEIHIHSKWGLQITGFKVLVAKFADLEEYVKTVRIKDRQMEVPFAVRSLEGLVVGHCGDWLAERVNGERYIIAHEIFRKTRVPSKEDPYFCGTNADGGKDS